MSTPAPSGMAQPGTAQPGTAQSGTAQSGTPAATGSSAVGGVPRPSSGNSASTEAELHGVSEQVVLRRLAVLVAVLVIGCLSLRAGWTDWDAFLPLVIAGGSGAALTALLRKIGATAAVTVLVGVIAPALVLIFLGRSQGDSVLSSLVDPFPRLLTAPFPAPVTTNMLMPGLVVAWIAGVAGAARIFSRHYLFTPILVGVSILSAGELLTAGRSDLSGLVTLAMVVVFMLHLSSWSLARHRGLPKATVAAVLLGAVALGVGYSNVLGEPFSPRDYIRQPTQFQSEPNPLPRMSEWAQHPDQEILRRSGDQVPLHIAVLPDYDGFTFGNSSKFGPLDDTARPVLPPGKPRQFKVNITTDTDMRWLPSPGTPSQVTIPDALVDPDTGTMIAPMVRQGVTSYTVTATVDSYREDAVSGADVPSAGATRYLTTPEMPPRLRTYAQEVTKDSATRWGQAKALEAAVRANRKFVPDAPGGSSYARLDKFLLADPSIPGGQQGTSEQFASSFAVLARSVGLPTRVVVGVGNGVPVPGGKGEAVVLGQDAMAWPEVYFTDIGWVSFNPTPNTMDPSQAAAQPGSNSSEPPPPPPPVSQPAPELVVPKPNLWLVPTIIGGALLVMLAAMVVARVVRRSRHRRGGSAGAWFDLEDAMRLAGLSVRASDPASVKAGSIDLPAARELATTAETATFGPEATSVAGADERAWQARSEASKHLRKSSSRWRRFIWPVSLAPWWAGRTVPGAGWLKSLWPGRGRRAGQR